jgi:hypothetical protein
MTELVEYRRPDAAGQLVAWADAAEAAYRLADNLVRTNVCPPPFRGKPQEATAVILLGAELGISPIASLRSMFDIKGTIGMYTRSQVALAQSRGHRIWTVSESDDAVTVAGHRAGDPEHVEEVTWTIARARQAGLIRRGRNGELSQYELQPRTMLWSRAAGDVARRVAADVLAGVPELDDPGDAQPTPVESGRVVQRRAPQPRPVDVVELPVEGGPAPQESPQQPPDAEPPIDTLPPDELPPEDVEPKITRGQMNLMQSLFIRAGARSPDDRHHYLTRWLDRPIESSNDITVTEASDIIDRLRQQVGDDA